MKILAVSIAVPLALIAIWCGLFIYVQTEPARARRAIEATDWQGVPRGDFVRTARALGFETHFHQPESLNPGILGLSSDCPKRYPEGTQTFPADVDGVVDAWLAVGFDNSTHCLAESVNGRIGCFSCTGGF